MRKDASLDQRSRQAIGYPLYGAGLYTNNVSATTWFMLFGSAFCGISAGFFWAA